MKTIAIFGAGSALRDLLSVMPRDVQILALGDNNVALHGQDVLGYHVLTPAEFATLPFDLCLIAARAVDPIRAQLQALGVAPERIAAYYPSYSEMLSAKVAEDIVRINSVLDIALPVPGIATVYMWPDASPDLPAGGSADFVRRQAIKLAAEMVVRRGVVGAVAELGVYQGETAAFLNRLFPDRDLHLFDTFAGFAVSDVAAEAQSGYSEARAGDFQDTDVARVLARMSVPDRVHLHKGFFPETTADVEALFAFVSLDVDLYAPTLAGLHWFYERLTPGGYIFVHDYNNARYSGVRHAIDAFLAKVPAVVIALPDFSGSVVIGR